MTNLPIAVRKPEDLVFTSKTNELVTDSILVATHFSKRHDNVVQKIKSLNCPSDFNHLNFQVVHYHDSKNEIRPKYQMTKDGFMLLVMGFTGKKAMDVKIAYINAFNEMEKRLREQPPKDKLDAYDILCCVRDLNQGCRKLRELHLDFVDVTEKDVLKEFVHSVNECGVAVDKLIKVIPKVTVPYM